MDRFLYIKLVKPLKRSIDQLYDDVDVIYQDYGDCKHQSCYVLEQTDDIFCERVTPAEQADKMADAWPIENICDYIKQKLDACEIKDLVILKTKIVEISRSISAETCSTLIRSIPRRLQCVIDKKGCRIEKEDFEKAD